MMYDSFMWLMLVCDILFMNALLGMYDELWAWPSILAGLAFASFRGYYPIGAGRIRC